jgi:hypothetical protein
MEYLERVIQEQDQRIQELVERLMEYENDRPRRAGLQSTATGNLLTRSAIRCSRLRRRTITSRGRYFPRGLKGVTRAAKETGLLLANTVGPF